MNDDAYSDKCIDFCPETVRKNAQRAALEDEYLWMDVLDGSAQRSAAAPV